MRAAHDGFTANMNPDNIRKWTVEILAWEKLIETLQPKNIPSPYDSDEAGMCQFTYKCNILIDGFTSAHRHGTPSIDGC